jgi:hypothetical protein
MTVIVKIGISLYDLLRIVFRCAGKRLTGQLEFRHQVADELPDFFHYVLGLLDLSESRVEEDNSSVPIGIKEAHLVYGCAS